MLDGKPTRAVSLRPWRESKAWWASTDGTSVGRGDFSTVAFVGTICAEWTQWPKYQASPAHILPEKSPEKGACLGGWRGDIGGGRRHWSLPAAFSSPDGRAGVGWGEQLHTKGNSRVQLSTRQARHPWTPPNRWEECKEVPFLYIYVLGGFCTVDGTYFYPQAGIWRRNMDFRI